LSDLLHRAFDFHQRADYANALPLLRQAWKLDPHDYFVNLLLGIDLLRTRKPEEAIDFLKEATLQRPKEEFPYAYNGEAQAMLGHYAEAAEGYLRALQANP
jgi:predicted Zn-dependent protease